MGIIGNLKSPKCVCGWQWANVFFMFFLREPKGQDSGYVWYSNIGLLRNHVEPCLTVLCTPGHELMMFLGVPDPFLAESNSETPWKTHQFCRVWSSQAVPSCKQRCWANFQLKGEVKQAPATLASGQPLQDGLQFGATLLR